MFKYAIHRRGARERYSVRTLRMYVIITTEDSGNDQNSFRQHMRFDSGAGEKI